MVKQPPITALGRPWPVEPGRPWRLALAVLILVAATTACLWAQEVEPPPADSQATVPAPTVNPVSQILGQAQLSGRITASLGFLTADSQASDQTWSVLGQAGGRIGLTTNGRVVKPELRASFNTWPSPALVMDRAWVKFRFDSLRATVGLGKLGWGPGLILVPGDLFFDATGTAAALGSDETRPGAAWLANLWMGIADESFVEAMLLSPDPQLQTTTLPDQAAVSTSLAVYLPGTADQLAGGARIVLGIENLGLELAWAHHGKLAQELIALSTQLHLGLDWYLTARAGIPWAPAADWNLAHSLDLGAGAFGAFDLGEGFSLSTRHELLVMPGAQWTKLEPALPGGPSVAATEYGLLAYHDLSLSLPEHFSLASRVLWSPIEPSALITGELGWAPLQALRLSLVAAWQIGNKGSTWNGEGPGAFSCGLTVGSSW